MDQLPLHPYGKCWMKSLWLAYLVSLLAAFAVDVGVSSLLYTLNVSDYRLLSKMFGGRAEFGFGEYQARLLVFQALIFVPLSVIVGLPGIYLLHRHHLTTTRYFANLGVALGLVAGVPLWLSQMKPSWGLLGILLGVVWALAYQLWSEPQSVLAMNTDACTWGKRAALTVGVFELIGAALWFILPFSVVENAKVPAFLVVGPLSVFPTVALGWYRPRLMAMQHSGVCKRTRYFG